MNVDDTVCSVYGNQEGSGVGYNPGKEGRASFKEKVGILGTTNEIINLTLEDGKHHTNYDWQPIDDMFSAVDIYFKLPVWLNHIAL